MDPAGQFDPESSYLSWSYHIWVPRSGVYDQRRENLLGMAAPARQIWYSISSPEQLSQSIPYAQVRGRNGHYRPPDYLPDGRISRAPSSNESHNARKRRLGKVMPMEMVLTQCQLEHHRTNDLGLQRLFQAQGHHEDHDLHVFHISGKRCKARLPQHYEDQITR